MNRENISIGQRLWWRDGGTVREVEIVRLRLPLIASDKSGAGACFPSPDDLYPTESAACDAAYARLMEDAEIMKDRALRTRQREDSSVESHLQDSDWLFDRCLSLGLTRDVFEMVSNDLRVSLIRQQEAIADNERIERRVGRETP